MNEEKEMTCKNCGHSEEAHKPINTADGPVGAYCEGSPNCACPQFESTAETVYEEQMAEAPMPPIELRSARSAFQSSQSVGMPMAYPTPSRNGAGVNRRDVVPRSPAQTENNRKTARIMELRKGMIAVMVAGLQGESITAAKWAMWLRTNFSMEELEAALSQMTDMRPSMARSHLQGVMVVPVPSYKP